MDRYLGLACLAGFVTVAACSGGNGSNDVVASCNSIATAICSKYLSCVPDAGTESACTANVEGPNYLNCAAQMCPNGVNNNNVSACVSAINALSCADAGVLPPDACKVNLCN
jgi:hypothetical protein